MANINEKVLYPVILEPEENDVFVQVPDIKGGYTQGKDTFDAIEMAKDVIGNLLEDISPENYPKASDPKNIKLEKGQQLVYVDVDMREFKRKYPRTVRRNVTIPEYLNVMAKNNKINVSKVLSEALENKLVK
ncbi:type II toxin-antitoxin system HicB family antitoxin [Apilactobacillus timberlakei]|uniref:type II toxin-antitoxin system HicB family antitoxin n=1 Tax=Apilactobacillus timberlakei TaxID=2008380 RepID=UPI0011281018|nr:type II toxin-antitoxin system HicB family antitoxin [Apilactobacillus timberlakei]TPR16666.1 antitoxin HicB [Apilactobacillus timberlakei]